MEIKFNTLQVMSLFVTAEECRELVSDSSEILSFCIEIYQNARSQPNRRTNKFDTYYSATAILHLISSFCAASTLVCREFLRLDGLAELRSALLLDPNGKDSEGGAFYGEILPASEILWQILLAENGRHVPAVRADPDIPNGTVYHSDFHVF